MDQHPTLAPTPRKRVRPLWRVAALVGATFGLYWYYWFWATWRELKEEINDDGMRPLGHLLSLLVPVYQLFRIYDHFRQIRGLAGYRAGGEGETIAYAHRQTSLGGLLMAATDRGVCFVQFGDNAATLLDQVRSEFPNANLVASGAEDSPELDEWVAALDAHITSG